LDISGILGISVWIIQDMSSAATETKTADADDDGIVSIDGQQFKEKKNFICK